MGGVSAWEQPGFVSDAACLHGFGKKLVMGRRGGYFTKHINPPRSWEQPRMAPSRAGGEGQQRDLGRKQAPSQQGAHKAVLLSLNATFLIFCHYMSVDLFFSPGFQNAERRMAWEMLFREVVWTVQKSSSSIPVPYFGRGSTWKLLKNPVCPERGCKIPGSTFLAPFYRQED